MTKNHARAWGSVGGEKRREARTREGRDGKEGGWLAGEGRGRAGLLRVKDVGLGRLNEVGHVV